MEKDKIRSTTHFIHKNKLQMVQESNCKKMKPQKYQKKTLMNFCKSWGRERLSSYNFRENKVDKYDYTNISNFSMAKKHKKKQTKLPWIKSQDNILEENICNMYTISSALASLDTFKMCLNICSSLKCI